MAESYTHAFSSSSVGTRVFARRRRPVRHAHLRRCTSVLSFSSLPFLLARAVIKEVGSKSSRQRRRRLASGDEAHLLLEEKSACQS